jgi:hypothetical protein
MNYYINNVVNAASWFEAFSYCKSLGMNLFNPQYEHINERIVKSLEKNDLDSAFAVGVSRIGAEAFWYSMKTGLEIKADLPDDDDKGKVRLCLAISNFKDSRVNQLIPITCDGHLARNFICESEEF